jgi:chromosome segregation ATPase
MNVFQKLGLQTVDPADELAKAQARTQVPEPAEDAEDAPVAAKNKKVGSKRPSATDSEEDDSDTSAQSDSDIMKSLYKAINDAEGEGFDFVKFMKMLKKNSSLDESSRYTAAISAAEVSNVSSNDLVSSGQDSLKILNGASKKFDADLAEQEEEHENNKKELENVEAQLESLNAKQKSLTKKIESGEASIENQRKGFDASLETVSDEVKAIIANIKKYSK